MWQVLVITSLLMPSWGATAFRKALDTKKNLYIDGGTIIGGEAGKSFSLLKVRRQADLKKKLERVVINLGDEQGRLLKGRVSFFQVNLEPKNSRLVVNLSQVVASKVSQEELVAEFKKSPFIRSVDLILDPIGSSTSLVLDLKRKVRAEVFKMESKGAPGRIVIDMIPTR